METLLIQELRVLQEQQEHKESKDLPFGQELRDLQELRER
jgi:hypothetical protein